MPASNTINGKAFEYACLNALRARIELEGKDVSTVRSRAYDTAFNAMSSLGVSERNELIRAANTAVKLLLPLEPKLMDGRGTLLLSIAADSAAIGADGDVRDVLCVRDADNGWTIGMSCKHNHEALRHPRITEGKDFGRDWVGMSCSNDFMRAITPVTNSLVDYGNRNTPWTAIQDKFDRYYVPILKAYLEEIQRMCGTGSNVPEKLLSYFFGANDFYKIIMKSSARTTTIEGFNMHGTLNEPCGRSRAMTRVPVIRMPTRLIDAAFKQNSKTTIVLTFDGGWSVSMRLHNKDKVAKPTSLAWDVNLIGLPTSTYVNTHSWDE